jgi:hypothetical protein
MRPNKKRHRIRAPLDAAILHVKRNAQAVEGNLGGFCRMATLASLLKINLLHNPTV